MIPGGRDRREHNLGDYSNLPQRTVYAPMPMPPSNRARRDYPAYKATYIVGCDQGKITGTDRIDSRRSTLGYRCNAPGQGEANRQWGRCVASDVLSCSSAKNAAVPVTSGMPYEYLVMRLNSRNMEWPRNQQHWNLWTIDFRSMILILGAPGMPRCGCIHETFNGSRLPAVYSSTVTYSTTGGVHVV